MQWLTSLWLRLKALALRRKFDGDLEDEFAFHLAMREQKQRSEGKPTQEAHDSARRDFGNMARLKEVCREMRTFASFESFWQDLRFGLRGLRKTPGFTVIAIATLALGIGASTWCFNLVRQWVVQAVTYPHSEQLLVAWEIDTKKGWMGQASAPDYLDWREQSHEFEHLAAWSPFQFNLTGIDVPEQIAGARISTDFFRTLEVPPLLGRDFRLEEDRPGQGHVALISYGFWHERFNADPNLLDKTLLLDGERYTVIGVMPENFHLLLMGRTNIFVPLVLTERERANRSTGWLYIIGRLKSPATLNAAQQSMTAIAKRIEKQFPESNTNSGILLRSLSDEIGENTGKLGIYSGFVMGICLLLIVCTNIAGVYLARALMRRKEMTVRMALGARKIRVARQLVAESLWLVPPAVVLGLGISGLGANWVTSSLPHDNLAYLPNYGQLHMDWATFFYATAVSLLSVLLFTLAPMMETNKLDLTGVLKETTAASSTSLSGRKLRKALVIVEIVLALVVLVPAGLMSKSMTNRFKESPGFDPDHVLTAKLNLPAAKYREPAQLQTFNHRLLDKLHGLPQVEAAALALAIPFGHSYGGSELWIEGRPAPKPGEVPGMAITCVTSGYMSALKLHLVRGRFISDLDQATAPPVIVINQTLAQRFFHGDDPLNHKIRLSREDPAPRTIVGIVNDIKTRSLDDEPTNQGFIPLAQSPNRTITVVLRTTADPLSLVNSVRASVMAVDPDQPIFDVLPMVQRISDRESPYRIFAQFTGSFGILALFLAGIGIYGVMAYLVESRSREIGIRMACGAHPKSILWLVLSGNLRLVLAGLSIGLIFAWMLARLLQSFLYRVTANDPATYAAAIAVICGAVLLASLVPLRRAAKVDPMIVLRYE
jgi:putative ABC transport system permease protein